LLPQMRQELRVTKIGRKDNDDMAGNTARTVNLEQG
jgi:hypothetical protein